MADVEIRKLIEDRLSKVPKKFQKQYVSRTRRREVEEIRCRMCGTPIAGMMPIDTGRVEKEGSEKMRVIPMAFRMFGNYRQVQFRMDDGAFYEPPVCADCAKKVTLEDGEYLFACHLNEMMLSGASKIRLVDQFGYQIKEYLGVKK